MAWRARVPDIMHMTFSDDSKRIAYMAQSGDMAMAVVDGVEGKAYRAGSDEDGYPAIMLLWIVFSPDSNASPTRCMKARRVSALGLSPVDRYMVCR